MDKIRVLIADDQTLMRDGLKTILELEENIEVVALAKDGVEALELCSETKPQVVLMDIRMPNMDGVQCTKLIKEKFPNIVILILTTFDDEEFIVKALSNGASGYILKDIEGDGLIKSVKDAYKGAFILPSKIAIVLAGKIVKQYSNDNQKNNENSEAKLLNSFGLSEKETEIAKMLAQGFTNKQIASSLYISGGTVKNYVSNLYSKIGISDRTSAAIYIKDLLME
ncbi:response regulator transcription factor [Clostridium sp. CM028]|uniref:response regulator transcription factor n=1 Tax=Clostridium sp. CM028 TaxID=2851575 RepID=UPI001C6E05B7|nr:response regulator transcription factor [Clostridium sp. CM028]MBW9148969.1 response regulator transcription factor [Clostridium sp. CM028]WLC62934.1 response regulator transcription factor [Clostridium sp. CM028]